MTFRYLGTAAAEGIPALFCECDLCREARRLGGHDVRHRSGALINGDVLIDFPPDLYALKLQLDLDLARVRHVVLTHSHSDHFAAMDLEMYLPGYAHIRDRGPLTLYGSEATRARYREAARAIGEAALAGNVAFRLVEPFERFEAGGVRFTALPSVHGCPGSYVYLVEQGDVRLLYGNDSGLLRDDVMAALREAGPLTHVSLDATVGVRHSEYDGHMSLAQNAATRERMLALGVADARTRFVSTHFSHNGALPHAELCARMAPLGFEIAYDGMELIP